MGAAVNALEQIVLLAENARQFTDRELWQEMEREARAALKAIAKASPETPHGIR